MKKLIYLVVVIVSGVFASCIDTLDIPPKSILNNDNIYNENGLEAYMAGIYNRLPIDDYNVTASMSNDVGANVGIEGYFGWNNIQWGQLSTGETVNSNNRGIYYVENGYWSFGYQVIRSVNELIQSLPEYIGVLPGAESYIAEARFLRAYVYFQLVKRYGGVPIITKPQYVENGDERSLWVARSSHEDCYNFILDDLDYAIENMTVEKINGRANRYVAAAFKSRVAVYAGSIARYGGGYTHMVDNVRLCGIPAEKANDYYQQAWDAAEIVDEGGYELYTDATNLRFANVFVNADNSKESIFIRQYEAEHYVHSFDHIYSPSRMSTSYGNRFCVTLDWVELFDGLPLDPATGWIKTVDEDNNYIIYDTPYTLFENAELRLQGSIFLPGDVFRGLQIDLRRGIVRESFDPATAKIQKFVPDDGSTTTTYDFGNPRNPDVWTTTEPYLSQTPLETSTGVKLNKSGLDGPSNAISQGKTDTGFLGRKWLNPNLTVSEVIMHKSTSSWIDIRYAEVLLNRAEAALELAQNGVGNYGDTDMQTDAYECINKIRTRAGAVLLNSPAELSTASAFERGKGIGGFVMAPNRGLQLLRVERYKELAFEHKLYWDLRRWFTFDKQIYDYRRRGLNSFLFAKGATVNSYGNPEGKCIYDSRVCEFASNSLTFATKYYYEKISDVQIKTNPLLKQNNQY